MSSRSVEGRTKACPACGLYVLENERDQAEAKHLKDYCGKKNSVDILSRPV